MILAHISVASLSMVGARCDLLCFFLVSFEDSFLIRVAIEELSLPLTVGIRDYFVYFSGLDHSGVLDVE